MQDTKFCSSLLINLITSKIADSVCAVVVSMYIIMFYARDLCVRIVFILVWLASPWYNYKQNGWLSIKKPIICLSIYFIDIHKGFCISVLIIWETEFSVSDSLVFGVVFSPPPPTCVCGILVLLELIPHLGDGWLYKDPESNPAPS